MDITEKEFKVLQKNYINNLKKELDVLNQKIEIFEKSKSNIKNTNLKFLRNPPIQEGYLCFYICNKEDDEYKNGCNMYFSFNENSTAVQVQPKYNKITKKDILENIENELILLKEYDIMDKKKEIEKEKKMDYNEYMYEEEKKMDYSDYTGEVLR